MQGEAWLLEHRVCPWQLVQAVRAFSSILGISQPVTTGAEQFVGSSTTNPVLVGCGMPAGASRNGCGDISHKAEGKMHGLPGCCASLLPSWARSWAKPSFWPTLTPSIGPSFWTPRPLRSANAPTPPRKGQKKPLGPRSHRFASAFPGGRLSEPERDSQPSSNRLKPGNERVWKTTPAGQNRRAWQG